MQTESSPFEPLICINRIDETADATTFEFKKIDDSLFEYKAGQFLTFEVDVAGELEYRAYSLSSTPSKPETAAVTIKRVAGGKVSNYLLDNLQPGFALPAMAPAGEFTLQDNQSTTELLLMSAGSGITPCMSMARWLLDTQQQVNIHFIYSARSEADVIMADTLDALNEQYDNFSLTRILEQTGNPNDIQGMLDAPLFEKLIPDNRGRTIFTCGPAPYMQAVEHLAESMGFDMALFHKESFVPEAADETSESGVNYQVAAPQYGKNFVVDENQSLLDALEAVGVPIISACRTGFCGACKCKVTGEVESSSQETLTPEQIEQGYVLSCSAKAGSDLVIEI
ncbi:hybrid-cluster NAD(P)-dependent oxidoreductase [Psychromonas aquimarina]|uniref:hybrid-cluster NAD(P)-dependent oxidoreductase n=1 Tax=Psychromonas aquimarina TaxID=444919 RepID=UPI00040EC343|nr:hybrid-cluster NAD(P)-dependent oxidoreductase [Psychromonas aquimarina]